MPLAIRDPAARTQRTRSPRETTK